MTIAEIGSVQSAFLAPAWQSGIAQHANQGFGGTLVSGLQQVDQSVVTANAAVTSFALGENLPPHQVVMALEDARLSLQFALQVRSRLVEGYQELMRMQL